jgi:sugar phosphate isomerase/epimerase
MRIGCGTVIFNQLDLYGALQHISWAGYEGAELACMANMAQHIELNTKKAYIDEIKSVAKKHGLKLFAIEAFFGTCSEQDKIKSMTKVFEVAMKLNIPVVAVRSEGKMKDREATKQALVYLMKLCELAENQGLTIAVKPHVGHSFYNTETLLQLLNKINSAALGINLDSSNFFRAGDDPAEAVLKLGSKIVHVHIRDCSVDRSQGRTPLKTQIAGRGVLDWPNIIKNLKKIGYKRALDTQIIGAFASPLSFQMGIAAEARGYINRCLQELNCNQTA